MYDALNAVIYTHQFSQTATPVLAGATATAATADPDAS
jgi:hypothetical protein